MIITKKEPFTKEQVTLLSLSLDLKRITESIQRKSSAANIFNSEAKKWLKESKNTNDEYLKKLLTKIEETLELKNDLKKAEDCLMCSVLIQNRALQTTK